MHNLIGITERVYYIIHKAEGIVTHGYMDEGQLSTPESNTLESFATEKAYLARCVELKIDLEVEDNPEKKWQPIDENHVLKSIDETI